MEGDQVSQIRVHMSNIKDSLEHLFILIYCFFPLGKADFLLRQDILKAMVGNHLLKSIRHLGCHGNALHIPVMLITCHRKTIITNARNRCQDISCPPLYCPYFLSPLQGVTRLAGILIFIKRMCYNKERL